MRYAVVPSCTVRVRMECSCNGSGSGSGSGPKKYPDHLKRMDDAAKNMVKAAGIVANKMGDRHNKHIEDLIGFASEEVNFVMSLATEMKDKKKYTEAQVVDVVNTVDENDSYFEK